MKLANELTVPAPIEEAWAVMLDVERVAPCLPGASIDSTEGDEYRGTMKIKLGPISSSFQGTLRIEEADEAAHRAVLSARARDSRGQGTAAATITSTMSPAEGGGTHVAVETELRVTGPAASFGRGVMQDVSAKLMGQFADCLAAEMGRKPDVGAAAPGATAAEGQAAAEGGRGVALSGPLPPDVPAPPPTRGDRALARPQRAESRWSTSGRRTGRASRGGARSGRPRASGGGQAGGARGGRGARAAPHCRRSAAPEQAVTAALPLPRSNLREQVKDVLLQRIVEGDYEPGARIVETRIAQELGVSQGPVREALRDLEQLGCVVHEPGRGCSVRAFSPDDLLEAFPVRAALEALAARLAAGRISEAELAELDSQLARMRRAAGRGDAHDQSQANASFHATIVRAARNHILERQWRMLEPFSRTYLTVSRPGIDLLHLSDRHEPVLDALRRRDPDAAAEAMHEHLMGAAELLMEDGG